MTDEERERDHARCERIDRIKDGLQRIFLVPYGDVECFLDDHGHGGAFICNWPHDSLRLSDVKAVQELFGVTEMLFSVSFTDEETQLHMDMPKP